MLNIDRYESNNNNSLNPFGFKIRKGPWQDVGEVDVLEYFDRSIISLSKLFGNNLAMSIKM